MTDNVLTALISASSSALVAITALLLNYRGFSSIDSRFAANDNRMDRIERRLDGIQADLKEFYRMLAEHDKRLQRLEVKFQEP